MIELSAFGLDSNGFLLEDTEVTLARSTDRDLIIKVGEMFVSPNQIYENIPTKVATVELVAIDLSEENDRVSTVFQKRLELGGEASE